MTKKWPTYLNWFIKKKYLLKISNNFKWLIHVLYRKGTKTEPKLSDPSRFAAAINAFSNHRVYQQNPQNTVALTYLVVGVRG